MGPIFWGERGISNLMQYLDVAGIVETISLIFVCIVLGLGVLGPMS